MVHRELDSPDEELLLAEMADQLGMTARHAAEVRLRVVR